MAGRLKFCVTVTTAIIRRRLRGKRDLARAGFRGSVTVELALAWCISFASLSVVVAGDHDADRLKELQTAYVAGASEKAARAYHFGSQGPGDVFSNHTSHTNRLVPVYVFGRKADLGAVMGANSRYRDPEKIKAIFRVSAGEYGQSRAPSTPTRATSTRFRRKLSRAASGTSSSSGSTASTGRPPRPRPSSRQARPIQRARDRA